jgi:EAL and modified HD-GYP domain-containing signal transduction protein
MTKSSSDPDPPIPHEDVMSPEVSSQAVESMVHIARQAILDARGLVTGYELLYHGGVRDADAADGDMVAARLLTGAVLDLTIETLTDGRTAFINISKSLLVNGAATLLKPTAAVFELGDDIDIDTEVVEACRSLHTAGYRLALDRFVAGSQAARLLPYVAFVKIDVRDTPLEKVAEFARRLAARRVTLVADKVETRVAFERARDAGCGLFQGTYFRKPEMRSGGSVAAQHAVYLRLLSALSRPKLSLDDLEALVKQHAVLSVRILQCVNSAAFAIRREVHSIREALVFLGTGPIRKWASVWCLSKINTVASEITMLSLIRARSCELLGKGIPGLDTEELFIVGLCSVLDTILGRPMAEAISELPLSDEARAALLGEPGPMRSILDAVVAYETGLWEEAIDTAETLGAPEMSLSYAHAGAMSWARQVSAANLTS